MWDSSKCPQKRWARKWRSFFFPSFLRRDLTSWLVSLFRRGGGGEKFLLLPRVSMHAKRGRKGESNPVSQTSGTYYMTKSPIRTDPTYMDRNGAHFLSPPLFISPRCTKVFFFFCFHISSLMRRFPQQPRGKGIEEKPKEEKGEKTRSDITLRVSGKRRLPFPPLLSFFPRVASSFCLHERSNYPQCEFFTPPSLVHRLSPS